MVIDGKTDLELSHGHQQFRCCFVCGAGQALWQLESKPPSEFGEPFFPFLQYQIKAPANAQQLDSQGRCLACNVCYLLLMQQWKSYEEKNTPFIQRLYWMKRPPEEYKDVLENSATFFSTNKLQSIVGEGAVNRTPCNSNVTSDKKSPKSNETTLVSSLSNYFSCYLCSCNDILSSSCPVFVAPQKSKDTPFFTGILHDRDKQKVHEYGDKILLCKQCSSNLHRQWVEFEGNSIPYEERKYHIYIPSSLRGKSRSLSCYLCSHTLSEEHRHFLYCKQVPNVPFYPFLTNLYTPLNAMVIDAHGYTSSCSSCALFLRQQWNVFESSKVAQEERVYRICPTQKPFLPTTLEKGVCCILCEVEQPLSNLKRLYCNPGANMHIGLLESAFVKDSNIGFYDKETGETFVCTPCFDRLRRKWLESKERLFGVPVENKAFISNYREETEHNNCDICNLPGDQLVHVFNKSDASKDSKLFFVLKQFSNSKKSSRGVASVCKPCYANAAFQIKSSEEANLLALTAGSGQHITTQEEDDETMIEEKFDLRRFSCYMCKKSMRRFEILFLRKDLIGKKKKECVGIEVDDQVVVCTYCCKVYEVSFPCFFSHD